MRITGIVVALALVAGGGAGCTPKRAAAPPVASHDFIAADELAHATDLSLYDAIHRLRPNFLKPRGVAAYGAPETTVLSLYVNGQRMDSIDDLRRINCTEVLTVQFYEPHIANAKFAGHNNSGGAIAVTLKPLPDAPAPSDSAR